MTYLRWFMSFLASFALNFFIWLTGWFWALIPAALKLDRLPGWLYYMQSHDDTVYGLNTYGPMPKDRFLTRWWWATCWLCRNPGYAFDALVLGLPRSPIVRTGEFSYLVGDRGFGYKRNIPIAGRAYLKVWIGWHDKPKGGSERHMLKIAIGPKFDGDK